MDTIKLETLSPGDEHGTAPKPGDAVTVHYHVNLASDDTLLDSSRQKKCPFSFKLGGGRVIKGWDLGISQMTLHQRAKITIASHAAYDAAGCTDQHNASDNGKIPPNADLIFDVELLDINFATTLARYRATLDEWLRAKLRGYDEADALARAQLDAKHTSRDGYEAHLKGVAARKWDAERTKRFADVEVEPPPVDVATATLAAASLDGREEEAVADVSEPQPQPQQQQIERRSCLSHAEFAQRYRHRRPVILAGIANEWPALSKWQDSAHLRTLHTADVLVLRSKDGRVFLKRDCEHFDGPFDRVATEERRRSPFIAFHHFPSPSSLSIALWLPLSQVSDMLFMPPAQRPRSMPPPRERLYARAPLNGGLRAEVTLDALEELVGGAAGAHTFNEHKCGVWLGSGGCVTPLHYDMCHGFLAGVRGVKHFTYFAPEDFRRLYPRPEQSETSSALKMDLGFAAHLSRTIDASRRQREASAAPAAEAEADAECGADPDAERRAEEGPEVAASRARQFAHQRLAEATAWHATVLPGDVLYTPPYWWHHVETSADEAALSVLVPWDPTADEPAPACHVK